MNSVDVLETAGFKPGKIGAGDKEPGYTIGKTHLSRLASMIVLAVTLLVLLLVWSQFEIHFERRSLQRKFRKEEHHAASKLAKVEMELWSHFRDDIHESLEARAFYNSLNASYVQLESKIESAITQNTQDLGLSAAKANVLVQRIVRLLADHRADNLHDAEGLIHHLIKAGRKGEKLQKHLDEEIKRDMKHEVREMEAHEKVEDDGDAEEVIGEGGDADGDEDEHELKPIVQEFWKTYDEFAKTYPAVVSMKTDSEMYKSLEGLRTKLDSDENTMSDEDGEAELKRIDLQSVGIKREDVDLGIRDLLEVLTCMPNMPHSKLRDLEKAWLSDEKQTFIVLDELHELAGEGKLPSVWLERIMDEMDD
mmetsp:Transcript_106261/g.298891  ORF Transcript_106261/g.298891 Transcript_106261/m.298891 type:complete len:365 (-) Transcript_106261:103-1197(-)